jgi:heavy metal translocating P-type ATPase
MVMDTGRFAILDDPEELMEYARPLTGDPTRQEAILAVDAVHCAACTQTIAAAIDDEHARIEVNVVSRRARLEWDPSRHALSALLARMADIGYEPRPLPLDMVERADPRPRRRALWRMLVGIFCMMQVMMFAVPRYIGGDAIPPDLQKLMIWAEAMLTIPALIFAAGPFFTAAWRDTRQGRIGMDTPVALGIAITVITSVVAFYQGHEVYFDSVTMIIGLLLVARWLESRARERAAAGLGNSLARLPEAADRLRADGSIERVSRRRLQPGDRISVPAGTTFAVDGRILEGHSDVDESLLTGESEPQPRGPGMLVVSGSLNLRNPLIVEVTHRAADSRLAELNRLIERAATSRPTVLRTADRYAGPFLVCVLLVALIAGIVWWFIDPERAPWIAAAILIVTCPCALALAAPSALLATLGGLARRGIIIDRSDTLEALARSDVVLFDKTGTLTTSTPGIELVDTSPGLSGADALALAAAIERSSLHPVARAFAEAAHTATASATAPGAGDTAAGANETTTGSLRSLAARAQVREVTNLPAGGLQARLDIDSASWDARIVPDQAFITLQLHPSSQEHQPDEHTRAPSSEADTHAGRHTAPHPAASAADAAEGTAATSAVALQARFRLTETLRPGAAETLARLRADGVQCRIVSGDHADRVTHIARQLDLPPEAQRAGARPEDKLDLMREFQQQGRRVTMVGDGVNDAPVLSRADVSVSLASAAPLAQHHADILLLSERLDGLLAARDAARRALRIVHQNLIFSCLYNVLAIPLAAVGLVPPWLAGLGMAGSSLVVVLNALRAAR